MNSKDFSALARQILPSVPGYFVRGPLIFARPVGAILRAIYFEGSSFDKRSFYVWAFFLPLFVPTTHLSFTLGVRLRQRLGGDRWNADDLNLVADIDDAIRTQALPFLNKAESPRDLPLVADLLGANNLYVQEAIAYCLAWAGETIKAIQRLDRLTELLDTRISWQAEMERNAQVLKKKLLKSPVDAQEQLDTWERETKSNLDLP